MNLKLNHCVVYVVLLLRVVQEYNICTRRIQIMPTIVEVCPDIIPDIFKIVLEYSAYEDRTTWDITGDSGLIYDYIRLTCTNIVDVSRMVIVDITVYMLSTNHRNVHHLDLNILSSLDMSNVVRLGIFSNVRSQYLCPILPPLPQLQSLWLTEVAGIYSMPCFDLSASTNLTQLHLGTRFDQLLDISKNTELISINLTCRYKHDLDLSNLTKLSQITLNTRYSHVLQLNSAALATMDTSAYNILVRANGRFVT